MCIAESQNPFLLYRPKLWLVLKTTSSSLHRGARTLLTIRVVFDDFKSLAGIFGSESSWFTYIHTTRKSNDPSQNSVRQLKAIMRTRCLTPFRPKIFYISFPCPCFLSYIPIYLKIYGTSEYIIIYNNEKKG